MTAELTGQSAAQDGDAHSGTTENTHAVNHGLALAAALTARGHTQTWLAHQAGVSSQLVSNWVKGQREPLPRRAIELEEILDLEPGTLTVHLGFLPPAGGDITLTSPEDAIIADPQLAGGDKQTLLWLLQRLRT